MKFKQYQYLKQHLFEFTALDELKNRYEDIPTRNLSPLVLAYVGDAYYHLYIRTRLLNFEQSRVHLLNDFSNSRTCIGIVVIDNYEISFSYASSTSL